MHFLEGGNSFVAETVFEKADAQVAESIPEFSRASSAMVDAIDEGEGVIDDTVETMVVTFVLGVIVGGFIGWMR